MFDPVDFDVRISYFFWGGGGVTAGTGFGFGFGNEKGSVVVDWFLIGFALKRDEG